nr:nuclear protein UL24 [Psittacid alphaherpesvirus 6]
MALPRKHAKGASHGKVTATATKGKEKKASSVSSKGKKGSSSRTRRPRLQCDSLAARLAAGVRCHNRFYAVLVKELHDIGIGSIETSEISTMTLSAKDERPKRRRLLPKLIRIASKLSERVPRQNNSGDGDTNWRFIRVESVRLAFEVNLGRRKPDCLCVIEWGLGGNSHEMCESVCCHTGKSEYGTGKIATCVLIEIKTCKFSKSMSTYSKRKQAVTGFEQLMESSNLLKALMAPGRDTVVVIALLVFVARRSLTVLKVTCTRRFVMGSVDLSHLWTSIDGLADAKTASKLGAVIDKTRASPATRVGTVGRHQQQAGDTRLSGDQRRQDGSSMFALRTSRNEVSSAIRRIGQMIGAHRRK